MGHLRYLRVARLASCGGSLGPNAESRVGNQLQCERQLAGFANAGLATMPKLPAQAGVRVSRAKFDHRTDLSGAYHTAPCSVSGKTSESPITPHFAIDYQATLDTLFHASATKGYRIGGVNAPLGGSTFQPRTFGVTLIYRQ